MYAKLERKKCTKCDRTKLLNDFYMDAAGNRRRSWCKKCCNEGHASYKKTAKGAVATKKAMDKFRANPENVKKDKQNKSDWARELKYGLKRGQFAEMLKNQNHKCAIQGCKITHRSGKGLVVDHCHKTGKVRALLCDGCNRGLGSFRENKKAMIGAAGYILKFEKKFKK